MVGGLVWQADCPDDWPWLLDVTENYSLCLSLCYRIHAIINVSVKLANKHGMTLKLQPHPQHTTQTQSNKLTDGLPHSMTPPNIARSISMARLQIRDLEMRTEITICRTTNSKFYFEKKHINIFNLINGILLRHIS